MLKKKIKLCKTCGVERTAKNTYLHPQRGLANKCLKCTSAFYKKKRIDERVKADGEKSLCKKCDELLDESEFYKKPKNSTSRTCKKCMKISRLKKKLPCDNCGLFNGKLTYYKSENICGDCLLAPYEIIDKRDAKRQLEDMNLYASGLSIISESKAEANNETRRYTRKAKK